MTPALESFAPFMKARGFRLPLRPARRPQGPGPSVLAPGRKEGVGQLPGAAGRRATAGGGCASRLGGRGVAGGDRERRGRSLRRSADESLRELPRASGDHQCRRFPRAGWPWRLLARAPTDPYVLALEHTVPQPADSPPAKDPEAIRSSYGDMPWNLEVFRMLPSIESAG